MTPAVPERDIPAATARTGDNGPEQDERQPGRRTGRAVQGIGNWAATSPAIVEFSRGRQRAQAGAERCLPGERPAAILSRCAGPRRSLRQRGFTAVGALGAVGVLAVPMPVSAAPAPCEQADRYAAQSGSQILRINSLGQVVGSIAAPEGDSDAEAAPAGPVAHIGDAKSAMVAQSTVNSAAVARMIDVREDDTAGVLTAPLVQQAPPTNKKAAGRSLDEATVGPAGLGDGKLSAHARWERGMACGVTVGEVTRASARLRDAGILADGDTPLMRVPEVESKSTTGLERNGSTVTTVATAGLSGGGVEVLGGAVTVTILEPPSLRVSMSTQEGGEVRYIPAKVEVSGEGVETARLDTAGDSIEITLPPTNTTSSEAASSEAASSEAASSEAASSEAASSGAASPGTEPSGTDDATGSAADIGSGGETGPPAGTGPESTTPGAAASPDTATTGSGAPGSELLDRLPGVGTLLGAGDGASLPEVPDVPEVSERVTESVPVAGSGIKVMVSLGDLQQAARGHAIAARAAAVSVTIAQGPSGPRTKPGYVQGRVIDFDLGVLEAAALAPEPAAAIAAEDVTASGAGGGLPITGRPVAGIVLTGLALIAAGATALILGLRGRSRS